MNKCPTWIIKIMALTCLVAGQMSAYGMTQESLPNAILGMTTQEMKDNAMLLKEIPKDLYKLKIDLHEEIIYELIGTQDGLGWSFAIADILESKPHFHKHTLETYTIVTGILEVYVGDASYVLYPGDVFVIPLNTLHWAKSLTQQPARLLVSCVPGWTPEDHILSTQGR